MGHTRDWDSGVPIDHTKFKAIPGAIAALALDIEERLQAFFYGFTSGETSDGIKYLPFWVQTTAPTGAANKVCIYSEDSTSKAALKVKTEDNAEIQLTERDWGLLDDFALGNNTPLRARNAADDGFVNLLKADGSNIPTLPDGAKLASTAAPTQDYEIPNKKYVDDEVAGVPAQVGFGAWVAKSADTVYQAATDGFVVASGQGYGEGDQGLFLYTDSSNPPTTLRAKDGGSGSGTTSVKECVMSPVKKNDYYKIVNNTGAAVTVYWIPLGS